MMISQAKDQPSSCDKTDLINVHHKRTWDQVCKMSAYSEWSFLATSQRKEGKPAEKTDNMSWKMYAPNITFSSWTILTATTKHTLSWLSRRSKASSLHASIRRYLCAVWQDDIKHWFSSLSVAVKAGHAHASLGLLWSTHQWRSLLFGTMAIEVTKQSSILVFSLPAVQLQNILSHSASLPFLSETKAFQTF